MKLWAPAQYSTPDPKALHVKNIRKQRQDSFGPSVATNLNSWLPDKQQYFQLNFKRHFCLLYKVKAI